MCWLGRISFQILHNVRLSLLVVSAHNFFTLDVKRAGYWYIYIYMEHSAGCHGNRLACSSIIRLRLQCFEKGSKFHRVEVNRCSTFHIFIPSFIHSFLQCYGKYLFKCHIWFLHFQIYSSWNISLQCFISCNNLVFLYVYHIYVYS